MCAYMQIFAIAISSWDTVCTLGRFWAMNLLQSHLLGASQFFPRGASWYALPQMHSMLSSLPPTLYQEQLLGLSSLLSYILQQDIAYPTPRYKKTVPISLVDSLPRIKLDLSQGILKVRQIGLLQEVLWLKLPFQMCLSFRCPQASGPCGCLYLGRESSEHHL